MSDMSEVKHLNLTAVARELHATTPRTRELLEKHGVTPVSEIKMPSNRVYTLYDAKAVAKAVKAIKRDKLGYDPEVLENLQKAPKDVDASPEVKKLASEVKELKDMLAQNQMQMGMLLDHLTKPESNKK